MEKTKQKHLQAECLLLNLTVQCTVYVHRMVNQLFNESTWQYYMHCPVCINALYTARTTEVCATYSVDNITLQIGHYIKFHKYVPCEHYITKRRIIKDRLTAVKLSFKDNRFQGISYNMVVKVGTFGKFSFEPLLSGRRTLYTVPLLHCCSGNVSVLQFMPKIKSVALSN